jgi:protein kinase-like protein
VYCLVMECAEHGDLSAWLDGPRRGRTERWIRREIKAILRVLDKLHRGRALHRDITPMNILVCRGPRLKLGDFGIARHDHDGKGVRAGTANRWFIPARMYAGEYKRWVASDEVFQVGQLLAFLVNGDAHSLISTRDVRQLKCGRPLKAVIRRAIDRDREHRYRDAGEMLRALRRPHTVLRGGVRTLAEKGVTFTGRLSVLRATAARWARMAGATVIKDVTNRTDVIIEGADSPQYLRKKLIDAARVDAARLREGKARVRLIGEPRFRHLVNR